MKRKDAIRLVVNDLKECVKSKNLVKGRAIHQAATKNSYVSDIYVANTLINMYAKCGCMEDAAGVFLGVQHPTVVSWTALILGYANNGKGATGLDVFSRMRGEACEPDAGTFVGALMACIDLVENGVELLGCGKQVHLLASLFGCDLDIRVQGTLLNMYAKCRSMLYARKVFDTMEIPDVVSWTTLILGYADNGDCLTSLSLFSSMGQLKCTPDERAFVATLKACSDLPPEKWGRETGKKIHLLALKAGYDSNPYVQATLVDMYSKSESIKDAQSAFKVIKTPSVVSWNALILGCVENGESLRAIDLFLEMRSQGCMPNEVTFLAALKACSNLVTEVSELTVRAIHMLAMKNRCNSHTCVEGMLVDLYSKHGCMNEACRVFDSIKHPDVVTWTALMIGYADSGKGGLSLELFTRKKREGLQPDALAFIAVLRACAMLGALDFGKAVHAEIRHSGLKIEGMLANYLVDFYAKCGNLSEAEELFQSYSEKNLTTWNAIIAGYSRHGDVKTVCVLFDRMCDSGVHPNDITLLCALRACSHGGLVSKGKAYFETVSSKYGIFRGLEHYNCMIDILGRANKLGEAMFLQRNMPMSPDSITWMTVLGACRKWKNLELAIIAFRSLTSLDDKNSAAYVLMATIYGSKGMWEHREAVLTTRIRLQIWKQPGQSWWTTRAGTVHTFMSGDKSHPQMVEINEKLKELLILMRRNGYVADLSGVTRNMSDVEKQNSLCGHSEKLAIACALINTKPGETIRIIKNLRVCDDCHVATRLISKLESRTIVCRDTTRFHVFQNGNCSCGDFW